MEIIGSVLDPIRTTSHILSLLINSIILCNKYNYFPNFIDGRSSLLDITQIESGRAGI